MTFSFIQRTFSKSLLRVGFYAGPGDTETTKTWVGVWTSMGEWWVGASSCPLSHMCTRGPQSQWAFSSDQSDGDGSGEKWVHLGLIGLTELGEGLEVRLRQK